MEQIILVQEEPRGPSQLIEVPIPAQAVSTVAFPDIQQLRSMSGQRIIIKAIRLITAKVLAVGPTTNLNNAAIAELRKCSLIIYCEGWEKGQLIPVLTLNDVADADATAATTIPYRQNPSKFANWENVDWSKTKAIFNPVTSGAAYCLMFDVEYVKLDSQGKEIIGPS